MLRILALFALALCAVPAAGQVPAPAAPAAAIAAARDAEQIAAEMLAVQEVTALAQRQYAGMVAGELGPGFRGAVAFPEGDPGAWKAVIVGSESETSDSPLVMLAEYEIAQRVIVAETLYPAGPRPKLTGVALAMAQAKAQAPRAVLAQGRPAFCYADGAEPVVSFSTLVLPPRGDGTFDAYVLNGPIEQGAIPLGKHFRVGFDQFGVKGEPVMVTDTCEVVTWDAQDPELEARVYVTELPAHDAPSAVHAFLSALLPMNLAVVTGDLAWPITGGTIAPPVAAAAD